MKYRITLKATLTRGTLYWVADLDAVSEEKAVAAAEALFEAQIQSEDQWAFDDFDVERI